MSLNMMESNSVQMNPELPAGAKGLQIEAAIRDSIESLKDGVFSLLRAVESLEAMMPETTPRGINFSDEVKRFEISLIRRALLQADGNQTRAALFLNMNKTTLNSMVKRYRISLCDLKDGERPT